MILFSVASRPSPPGTAIFVALVHQRVPDSTPWFANPPLHVKGPGPVQERR